MAHEVLIADVHAVCAAHTDADVVDGVAAAAVHPPFLCLCLVGHGVLPFGVSAAAAPDAEQLAYALPCPTEKR